MPSNALLELKKRRQDNRDQLKDKLDKTQNGGGSYEKDERYWNLSKDSKTGVGSATIRFLPAPQGEDDDYVRMFTHGFEGPGGWYVENCRSTLNNAPDPAHQLANTLYKAGKAGDKASEVLYGKVKRRTSFHSNILVIKDPEHPENNGKVFLFRYGKKILDKIQQALKPEFEGQEEFDPFDFWEGANFRLRVRKVEGMPNYDASTFDSPSELGDDDEIAAVWKQAHSLKAIVTEDKFKSYDELKARLTEVMADEGAAPASEREPAARPKSRPIVDHSEEEAPRERRKPVVKQEDDDDDELSRLKALVDED